MVAVRDGHGDHGIVATAVLAEQQQEGGELDHEGRGAVAAGQRGDPFREIGRQHGTDRAAVRRGSGRAREVGGEFDLAGVTGEAVFPPGDAGVGRSGIDPPPVPRGVVEVVRPGGERGRRGPLEKGGVAVGEVADEDADRPAVGDDVVGAEPEQAAVGPERDDGGADRGVRGEVEGTAGELAEQDFGIGAVKHFQRRRRGVEVDDREAVDVAMAAAQDGVAGGDFGEGALEGC